jgi:molybdopterin molybdotransferase
MLSVEEAQAQVLEEIGLLGEERVPLAEARGRVLREDVTAPRDLPPGDNSAMDGYAVRAADVARATPETPVRLEVVADIAAGHPVSLAIEPGTCMRIMTGALVPEGADAVVQVEWTDGGRETVAVSRSVREGANLRRRGEDMREGAVVLHAGSAIGPGEIGLLAGLGRTEVVVAQRPVVAIFSTGDELVEHLDAIEPGRILNTNGPLLAALVEAAGGIARPLGIVRDAHDATVRAFEDASSADFTLSSGGVSVGAFDYVKGALEALGAETKFWRVAMKPGKPLFVSRLRGKVVFGLPGNPVSCFVSFHLFVAPALRKALGLREPWLPPRVRARLGSAVRSNGERRVFARATLCAEDGELVAHPLTSQGSGSLTSMAGVNALVIVEEGMSGADANAMVEALVLGPLQA